VSLLQKTTHAAKASGVVSEILDHGGEELQRSVATAASSGFVLADDSVRDDSRTWQLQSCPTGFQRITTSYACDSAEDRCKAAAAELGLEFVLTMNNAWPYGCFLNRASWSYGVRFNTNTADSPSNSQSRWSSYVCEATSSTTSTTTSRYVPGTPGAAWSVEEQNKVRAKIHRIMAEGNRVAFTELGLSEPANGRKYESWPSAGKLLRLGFHDCLIYEDGTKGCDGCLEWNLVKNRYNTSSSMLSVFSFDGPGDDGHNNGLGYTVDVLEEIYTDGTFPDNTPCMTASLRDTGKSRADLWAFATLVSVEWTIALNNLACVSPRTFYSSSWGSQQHHPRAGEADCNVTMPRGFVFKTGRQDCVSSGGSWEFDENSHSYKTNKTELHPDAMANGSATVAFFKRDFNFTGEETVAILGAHTIGSLNQGVSLFRYSWLQQGNMFFNNYYFRNMAMRKDWFYASWTYKQATSNREHLTSDDGFIWLGNATGGKPAAEWTVKCWNDFKPLEGARTDPRGNVFTGPCQWVQKKYVCTDYDADATTTPTCTREGSNPDTNDGEYMLWQLVSGIDESMMSSEMGLYFKFGVDSNGIPTGCKYLNSEHQFKWGMSSTGKQAGGYPTPNEVVPECDLNDNEEPAGSRPLYQIVEDFADNQQNFIDTFIPTLEKIVNHVDTTLTTAPSTTGTFEDCPFQDLSLGYSNLQYTCSSTR